MTQNAVFSDIVFSTASNPLTAPLPKNADLSPTERATERFSVRGNAIVTGGVGGIGMEACRALLEHGLQGLSIFDLASRYASEEAQAAIAFFEKEFPRVKILKHVVDVTDEDSVQNAVEETVQTLGSVEILLCFAGIGQACSAENMSLEIFQRTLNVNATGSFLVAKHVGKQMIKQGTGGSIVFTASIAAHRIIYPVPQAAYNVSKGGILQLKSSLAAEWAQYGIRVNSISPGFFETVMTRQPGAQSGVETWEKRCPLGRMGQPDELTGPIIMFCSPAGRFITGTDIIVDGGGLIY
ncbi:hypothetical protein NLJ89_g6094 [Agrocybe chaxingu]|uniref:NAD(P)-binding protein n=1 Tax=Agrocybe chaxingu TaxID=84603 RepID=A0A9W8JZT2_9AGAR|nr:hypothetical protein NLJ89_g6094 [Agrocybe chaxingu]